MQGQSIGFEGLEHVDVAMDGGGDILVNKLRSSGLLRILSLLSLEERWPGWLRVRVVRGSSCVRSYVWPGSSG